MVTVTNSIPRNLSRIWMGGVRALLLLIIQLSPQNLQYAHLHTLQ